MDARTAVTQSPSPVMDRTDGHLLNGRVRYVQPRAGFRSGIEPVLLAAAIPARPAERVLEGGAGAGAALLCLRARIPDVAAVGIELDPAMADLAGQNAAANGWPDLRMIVGDLTELPPIGAFDHVIANPPYHDARGSASPIAERRLAKRAVGGGLAAWATALGRSLRARGTLTFILPAASLPEAMAAFTAADCAPTAMLPLWPKRDVPAKLLLLRGIKGGRGAFRVLPGLVLHRSDGGFTTEADAILRDGGSLNL